MGWTLPKLGEQSGLTPNYIGNVELGLRDPSLSTMLKIAEGLDVPLTELLGVGGQSPVVLEFLRLLSEAPPEVQAAVEDILRSVRKPRR